MALKISIDFGGSTRWDLVTSTENFWYRLKAIHCLTNQGQWELRIDYKFTNGTRGYLYYKNFKVGPPSSQYQLTISGYADPATHNSANRLNSMKFTTKDRDNDQWSNHNCAVDNWEGWWMVV